MDEIKLGKWEWVEADKSYVRYYLNDDLEEYQLAISIDSIPGDSTGLSVILFDQNGRELWMESYVKFQNTWAYVMMNSQCLLEDLLDVEIPPAEERASGIINPRIVEIFEQEYDAFSDETKSSGKVNLARMTPTIFAGVDKVPGSWIRSDKSVTRLYDDGENDDKQWIPDPGVNMSKDDAETVSSGSLLMEGTEMGGVSAVIEFAAKDLMKRCGADPNNVVALHSAKIAAVLFLRHFAVPMAGDSLPKKDFIERRLEMALKGCAATASFTATKELMEFSAPILSMLSADTMSMVKLLANPGFTEASSIDIETKETVRKKEKVAR